MRGIAEMLRPVTAAAVLLLAAGCGPQPPHPLPEPSQLAHGQGRLWRVDGPGIAPSHIFGTFQIYDKRLLDLPAAVESAYAGSEALAVEDFGSLYAGGGAFNLDSKKLPEGQSLESLIGARSFGILTWHFKRSEFRPKDNVKPWLFWLYMGGLNWGFVDYSSLYENRADFSVAETLKQRARRDRKQVKDLESVRELFDVLDAMPLENQANMLQVLLDRYSSNKPRVPEVELYLNGDLARLDALWREYLGWLNPATAAVLDDRLINDRNPVLVDRMVPLMQEAPTFVSIDVRHLSGGEGVLRLLERRGFTVTRLE